MLTVNFLSSSNFYKVRISANYEKIIFQCITLFIALAGNENDKKGEM
jgi:hypothetical protein